jgi:pentose-5-phosphate-3-epimerase
MVTDPLSMIDDLIETKFDRVIFHLETVTPALAHTVIGRIKSEGMQVGIALNPETPVANALGVYGYNRYSPD